MGPKGYGSFHPSAVGQGSGGGKRKSKTARKPRHDAWSDYALGESFNSAHVDGTCRQHGKKLTGPKRDVCVECPRSVVNQRGNHTSYGRRQHLRSADVEAFHNGDPRVQKVWAHGVKREAFRRAVEQIQLGLTPTPVASLNLGEVLRVAASVKPKARLCESCGYPKVKAAILSGKVYTNLLGVCSCE